MITRMVDTHWELIPCTIAIDSPPKKPGVLVKFEVNLTISKIYLVNIVRTPGCYEPLAQCSVTVRDGDSTLGQWLIAPPSINTALVRRCTRSESVQRDSYDGARLY